MSASGFLVFVTPALICLSILFPSALSPTLLESRRMEVYLSAFLIKSPSFFFSLSLFVRALCNYNCVWMHAILFLNPDRNYNVFKWKFIWRTVTTFRYPTAVQGVPPGAKSFSPLIVLEDALPRRACDGSIASMCGGRLANNEAQRMLWLKQTNKQITLFCAELSQRCVGFWLSRWCSLFLFFINNPIFNASSLAGCAPVDRAYWYTSCFVRQ